MLPGLYFQDFPHPATPVSRFTALWLPSQPAHGLAAKLPPSPGSSGVAGGRVSGIEGRTLLRMASVAITTWIAVTLVGLGIQWALLR
jgi:hypothetical protein